MRKTNLVQDQKSLALHVSFKDALRFQAIISLHTEEMFTWTFTYKHDRYKKLQSQYIFVDNIGVF